jgi:hypothetical protein
MAIFTNTEVTHDCSNGAELIDRSKRAKTELMLEKLFWIGF